MKRSAVERISQLILLLVLLEGPYRAFVARRVFQNNPWDNHQNLSPKEDDSSTTNDFPFYLVSIGPFGNPHEVYQQFDLLPFYKPDSPSINESRH